MKSEHIQCGRELNTGGRKELHTGWVINTYMHRAWAQSPILYSIINNNY